MSESQTLLAPSPAAAEPVPEAANDRTAKVLALLAAWMVDCIHNSPVSQATEAFNHLSTTAVPELARRILSEI